MFFRQYQRQRKCFLSERELKKALRDTLTRAAWLGPVIFWLVRSEHAHASYPGLFFCPPGISPSMGREERRVQGLDYEKHCFDQSVFVMIISFLVAENQTLQGSDGNLFGASESLFDSVLWHYSDRKSLDLCVWVRSRRPSRPVHKEWKVTFILICDATELVFLSRNYWLIVALWKFDVLKTSVCPKSEACRAKCCLVQFC